MKYVYQLEIEGTSGLCGDGRLVKRTSTVFTSERAAKSRVEKAKLKAVERNTFGLPMFCPDYPVHVTIRKLEIIRDESWIMKAWNYITRTN